MDIVWSLISVLHVLGAVVWAGFAFYQFMILTPALQQAGPASGPVMQRVLNGRLLNIMKYTPIVVIVAGLMLYDRYTGHGNLSVILGSYRTIALTIGALVGIAAFFEGMFLIGPTAAKMRDLSNQMASAGDAPSPEMLNQMQALRERMGKASTRGVIFLLIAVIGMALGGG